MDKLTSRHRIHALRIVFETGPDGRPVEGDYPISAETLGIGQTRSRYNWKEELDTMQIMD
jgi:hypothetical protein